MDVKIPPNTRATVFVPSSNEDIITESGKKLSTIKDIKVTGSKDGYIELNLGSGIYHFEAQRKKNY